MLLGNTNNMVNASRARLNVGSQLSDQRESGTLTLTHWARQGLHCLCISKRSNHLNIVSLSVCMCVCVFAHIVFMSTRCSLCVSLSQSIVYIYGWYL